jgi:L-threonylcarbamoyladenylate synthase
VILRATEENIQRAAEAIRAGKLIGMPTETVYGVAANALDKQAVLSTFAAKGRPADNPLIVHLASIDSVLDVAASFPSEARRLASQFWPGPLTLVLPKRTEVPLVTTGGLETVAVRVPAHPVARALIEAAGVPISAPSANMFMGLSPTRAEDVDPRLVASLEFVLDGGPCEVGVESTVVDVSRTEIRLLRPGGVSRASIETALGFALVDSFGGERRSPGMYPRHYAPRTPVRVVKALGPGDAGIVTGVAAAENQISLPADPVEYAAGLYTALHALDRIGASEILVQSPPETGEWEAVWNRLSRAAS